MSASQKSISLVNLLANTGTYLQVGNLNQKTTELTRITRQIGDTQAKLQRLDIALQKEQLEVQKRQLETQNKMLIQLELQNMIKAKELLEKERQKELKNVFFSIKTNISAIKKYKDNVTQFVYLARIEKDISRNNLRPSELEELQDKDFASTVLDSLSEEKDKVTNALSGDDKQDLEQLETLIPKSKDLKTKQSDLEDAKRKIEDIKKEKPISHNMALAIKIFMYFFLSATIASLVLMGVFDKDQELQRTISGITGLSAIAFAIFAYLNWKKNIGKRILMVLTKIEVSSIEEVDNKINETNETLKEVKQKLSEVFSRHPDIQFVNE